MKGILIINKEKSYTSHDCVNVLRKLFQTKKIGHTGTLDPLATGVLPMCVGKATKVAEYIQKDKKTYRALAKIGARTDTLDADGVVVTEGTKTFSKALLIEILKRYEGEIEQIPPMYSAIKVEGKKLYEYARRGEEVERKARKVRVHKIELLSVGEDYFVIKVTCSSGTYIRTLVDSIGEDLGTYAYISELQRLSVGEFSLNSAITLQEIENIPSKDRESLLLPMDQALQFMKKIQLSDDKKMDILYGKKIFLEEQFDENTEYRCYSGDEFMGIGKIAQVSNGSLLHVHKVLYER